MWNLSLFWGSIAILVVLASLAAVLAPLLRGGDASARRASFDMQVYRDQLGEIDADLVRGVLSTGEAEATRAEVGRRLIAAADAETEEHAAQRAPRLTSRLAVVVVGGAMALAAGGIYLAIGAPGMPDQPLAARLERQALAHAGRPGQAEAEALIAARGDPSGAGEASSRDAELIARLREVLADRPDDVEGRRLLARSLAATGAFAEARVVQAEMLVLLGERADATDRIEQAHLMILATNGYVSPEAETLLAEALAEDPQQPLGRYYSGRAFMQAGRADLAYPIWSRLLEEGPPDAPWIAAIEAEIDEAARLAGVTRTMPRGPTRADVEAAGQMSAADRNAMIATMVDGLSSRLAADGGPAADWARLLQALGVLGRHEEAAAILAEARAAFADDPAGLAEIDAAAGSAGSAP